MTAALVQVDGLSIRLPIDGAPQPVVRDVSFTIGPGEALGLVGESGSGKSMTARALIGLLPAGAQVEGEVAFDGASIRGMTRPELRRYRSSDVAMIFQDPRAHTNPVRTIGDFITEALRTNLGVGKEEALERAAALLVEVGISDAPDRLRAYPHELSGGMLQRVMIAAALAVEPRLILADEPTTALDVTTQADVMAILDELRRDRGLAMLFITHDLDLAAAVCDRTAVMYAGSLVEDQPSSLLHEKPLHPYTAGLSACRPSATVTAHRLRAIPGRPLSAYEAPPGCAFAPRCAYAEERCRAETQVLQPFAAGHTACRRSSELVGRLSTVSHPEKLSAHG